MNFVILGNICIDQNTTNKIFYKSSGGPAIFMYAFYKQIKDVSLITISSYGSDFLPYKNGLNLIPATPNVSKTLVYENIEENGKRSQKCHNHIHVIPPVIRESIKNTLRKANVLFIAPLLPNFSSDYIKQVIALTKQNCAKILLPQGYFRQFDKNDNVIVREFMEAGEILPLVDVVILSSEDYPNIEDLAFEWNKQFNTPIIITKAEKGATLINKNSKVDIPTTPIPPEDIIDSIGAGDTFSASFGYHYLKSKDLLNSIEFANDSAKQAIRKHLL